MKLENQYFTDEQLERLISEVENNELVTAPPDFAQSILEKVDESCVKTTQRQNKKVKEFTAYCFRVLASAAAAIVLLFILPDITYMQTKQVPTKEEVLSTEKYATKDEVLNDTGLLTKWLGNIRVFNENMKIELFNEENGG